MSSEEEKSQLKKLINTRGTFKSQLTRFKNYLDAQKAQETPDLVQIDLRLSKIEPLLDQFNEIQSEIEILDISNTQISQENERAEFEDRYFTLASEAKTLLESFSKRDESVSVSSRGSGVASMGQKVKLPTINLPSFDGNFEHWLFFKDTFESLINQDNSITDINKFHYLRLSLKGQAAELLKSLECSSNNYVVAWNLLVERYENKPMLKKNHIKALFDLKPATRECHRELRDILDGMTRHLRALKVLGQPVDSWDALILHLISIKLDPITRREWECEYTKHDDATLCIFSKFLQEKCRLLETLIPENTKSKTNFKGLFSENHTPICSYCTKEHTIYNCKAFIDLNANSRLSEAKKLKLCINCLRNNHGTEQCRSIPCRKCQNKHNTLLHFCFSNNTTNTKYNNQRQNKSVDPVNSNVASLEENPDSQEDIITSLLTDNMSPGKVLLSTALVDISDNKGEIHSCRVILDSGSESSFISESLCKKLNLNTKSVNCYVSGIGQKNTNVLKQTDITIQARQVPFKMNIRCLVLPKITNKIPAVTVNISHLNIPSNLILADPSYNLPGPIDVLVGADSFWDLIMIGQIKLGKRQPTLQKTQLGWVISGSVFPQVFSQTENSSVSCNFSQIDDSLDIKISKFWEIEEVNGVKPLSPDDAACEELFKQTTTRNKDGRFVVTLPVKQPISSLGDSRETAVKCLLSLERKLEKNPELKIEYAQFLNEYESLGHMAQIDSTELSDKNCFYFPHHCVLKESSTTTKLRVVFNGSSVTTSGLSLNDILRVGPSVQEDLFSLVLRSRKHNILLTADIAKMYRQILVNKDQQHLQLILWRPNPTSDIQTYQLKTLTYGTTPAAFLATRCLKEISIQCQDTDPEISKIISKDFYMDDLCTGCSSVSEAKCIKQNISKILESFGFPLRKFMSNSYEILADNPESPETILKFGEPHENKTLGLLWNSHEDTLKYSIKTFTDNSPTKRKILSCVSQIFDPLGLLQPVIIIAKIIIQKLWQCKLSWDESIPLDLHSTWIKFQAQLQDLNKLTIPRHVLPYNPVSVQLHGFSDASEMAYGACIYLRSVDSSGSCHSFLLCSKTRVAPLKTVTIPRLELCGALLLAELAHKVKTSLDLPIDETFYWCDSTIALSWIKSDPQKWKIFVANRATQIQSLTDINSWRYINTQENPADLLSRGLTPTAILNNKLWWNGPKWLLLSKENWPTTCSNIVPDENTIPEVRSQKQISLATSVVENEFDLVSRFSSFNTLTRVAAYCCRFFQNCRKPKGFRKIGPLLTEELQYAQNKLIQIVQKQEFSKEYLDLSKSKQVDSKSNLLSLNPYMDENGIIRVGGRLKYSSFEFQKKHPAILPGKHIFSKLVATHEHLRLLHAGPQLLLASIRERFWPTSGRNLVKQVVKQCVRCFRFSATPTPYLMGDLPEFRVTPHRAFYNAGIDFCGPFLLKDRSTRNYKVTKAYVCLFVCLSTRAIHLELVSSLTTDAFIATLRRFFSRRGLSANLYSDHGTNFVGTKNEFDKFLAQHQDKIQNSLSQSNIRWHFIPPRSPHFGGIWEAGVKSTKFHLKRVLNLTPLAYEEFLTILNQVEACLNSRPLFQYSNDPSDPQPITPAHFLIGERLTSIPDHDYVELNENQLSKFQRLQRITQTFWKRWSTEFISELQQRSKWKKSFSDVLKPGAVVLIKEDGLPPLKWKLGVIEATHPGKDGIVRAATIRTGTTTCRRPAVKICLLPDGHQMPTPVS